MLAWPACGDPGWQCRSRPRSCSRRSSPGIRSGRRRGARSPQAAGARSRSPGGRRCRAAAASLLALLLALAAWSGLSIAWSVAPDRSWDELEPHARPRRVPRPRAPVRRRGGRGLPAGCGRALTVALGAAVLWALAGKAVPGALPGRRPSRPPARPDRLLERARARGRRAARARALVRCLGTERSRRASGGTVLAYAAVVAIFLSVSRTGLAAAVARGRALALARARTGSRRRCSRSPRPCPRSPSRPGRSRGPALVESGQPRAPTASRTAPGSGCSSSSGPRSSLSASASSRGVRSRRPRRRASAGVLRGPRSPWRARRP